MRKLLIFPVVLLPLLSGGCVAKTAFDIATMPVKAGAQAADWATTSQDEADRNYGRKIREQEAREGRERRQHAKQCEKRDLDPEDCPYTGYRAGNSEPQD